MRKRKQWLVIRYFEWSPNGNVVMTFPVGQIVSGLTRACIRHAGDCIQEIRAE